MCTFRQNLCMFVDFSASFPCCQAMRLLIIHRSPTSEPWKVQKVNLMFGLIVDTFKTGQTLILAVTLWGEKSSRKCFPSHMISSSECWARECLQGNLQNSFSPSLRWVDLVVRHRWVVSFEEKHVRGWEILKALQECRFFSIFFTNLWVRWARSDVTWKFGETNGKWNWTTENCKSSFFLNWHWGWRNNHNSMIKTLKIFVEHIENETKHLI